MLRRAVILGVVCSACSQTGSPENVPPVARLKTPVLADSRLPVVLDATRSSDADGTITTYFYAFGDGSPTVQRNEPTMDHVFPGPGRFTLQLTVRDDNGAEDALTRDITLVDRFTPPYCGDDEPCEEGQTCEGVDGGGVCFEETP